MTSQEIDKIAKSLARAHGDYSLLSNNCQDYVKRLLMAVATTRPRGIYKARLADDTVKHINLDDLEGYSYSTTSEASPDPAAYYRFKREVLQVMEMWQNPSPGYITPGAGITLINVKPTGKPDVWQGVVQNNGTSGYVHRSAIERVNNTML